MCDKITKIKSFRKYAKLIKCVNISSKSRVFLEETKMIIFLLQIEVIYSL